jgi:hypothetical protein
MSVIVALLLTQATVKIELRKEGAVEADRLAERVKSAGRDPLIEVQVEDGTPVEKGLDLLKRCYQADARRFKIQGTALRLRTPEEIRKDHSGELSDIVARLCVRGNPLGHSREAKAHLQVAPADNLSCFVVKIDMGTAKTPAERDALFGRMKERADLLKNACAPGTTVSRVECCPGVRFADVLRAMAALPQPAHFSVLGLGEPEGVERPERAAGLDPGTKILEIEK